MTETEKNIIHKLLDKADKSFSLAESYLQQVTLCLHQLGYDYEASKASGEIVFLKHGEPFEEIYNLDDLDKEHTK